MRVIAGSARGRRLIAPPGNSVRPTTDRVRESMFNRLDSLGLIRGAVFVDLFAGSGALGIEALSRGAASVDFVDQDAGSVKAIRSNLASLGFEATVHRMAAERFVAECRTRFDVALLDPPYGYDGWAALLAALPAEHAVIESGGPVDLPSGWESVRAASYGKTHVDVVSRSSIE